MPDAGAPGGHRLVIDNNSGTYAPRAEHLPRLAALWRENFPGGRQGRLLPGKGGLAEVPMAAAVAAGCQAEAQQLRRAAPLCAAGSH